MSEHQSRPRRRRSEEEEQVIFTTSRPTCTVPRPAMQPRPVKRPRRSLCSSTSSTRTHAGAAERRSMLMKLAELQKEREEPRTITGYKVLLSPGGTLRPTTPLLCATVERAEHADVSDEEVEDLLTSEKVNHFDIFFSKEISAPTNTSRSASVVPTDIISGHTDEGVTSAASTSPIQVAGPSREEQPVVETSRLVEPVASTSREVQTASGRSPVYIPQQLPRSDASDLDSDYDDDFHFEQPAVASEQTRVRGIDVRNMENSLCEAVEAMEAEMDFEQEALLGGDVSFNWVEDFESFRGVREQFRVVNPGPVGEFEVAHRAFTSIWSTDLMELIARETNRYAEQVILKKRVDGELKEKSRLHKWTPTNVEELLLLFAVYIYMGIDSRSVLKEYWMTTTPLAMPEFGKMMSYDRYILLNKFLHFVDREDTNKSALESGTIKLHPKVYKIAPLVHHLNLKFESLYVLHSDLCVDESLTLFKGRLSWVQCIRTKAARFGIKSFELCESHTGYMARFVIYVGKDSGTGDVVPAEVSADLGGKSTQIVLGLLKGLERKGYCVTMDNFYNSPALARHLKTLGFDCLGTLRTNRKNVPTAVKAVPRNVAKGAIIARHSGDVSVLSWKDSKVVTMISTFHNDDTVVSTRAGKVIVKPKSVNDYNNTMGGVDLKDQKLSMYLMERKRDVDGLCAGRGCCGAGARARLTQQSRTQLEGALRSELSKLADILANRAKKFDEFFRKLLQLSREEFHTMFKRTYGMIYEQHSYVFEQLFEQLERYYARGDTVFDQMMDGFFGILYQKMFTVLNSQYSFDEKYLKCVSEHMRDIQPFEDVPQKLSVQLRRAFVATRTFHKALRAGADVVRNMMQVGVTQECVTAWARLRFCGSCSGHQQPACSRYCHNLIRGCLPAHADLGEQWDAYVDAVEKVADRLLGPFNIAMVVEPIDIKISEAIMSFQEHNQEISQKIFAGCGKPVLGGGAATGPFTQDRARRSVNSLPDFDWKPASDIDDFEIEASFESLLNEDPTLLNLRTPDGIRKATEEMAKQAKLRERFLQYMRGNIDLDEYEEHERRKRDADPEPAAAGSEIDFRTYEFDGKRGGTKKKKPSAKADDGHGAEWGGPALEKLVRETRQRVRGSRRYWSHLPALLCASTSVTTSPCFNGTTVASYIPGTASEGSAALASNPEVRGIASAAGSGVARAQHDALRTLTARLKDAYNGAEVQWKDADDLQVASSSLDFPGSEGSGSGSGDDTDDTDDLPDDDEDRTDYPEGSGDSQPDFNEPTEAETESRAPPPTSEPPFVPVIVDQPGTNNVHVRARAGDEPPEPVDVQAPVGTSDDKADLPAVREQPVAGSADRPSLHKALFTYALPVVCAWFGTIVTDLF